MKMSIQEAELLLEAVTESIGTTTDAEHMRKLQAIRDRLGRSLTVRRRSASHRRTCADCGESGVNTGHMGCMYPGAR